MKFTIRILLENYYLPGDLEAQIDAFVADYRHLRYHESIGNLTSPTSTSGGQTILIERERIKRQTIANRSLLRRRAAQHCKPDEPETRLFLSRSCPKNSDDGQAQGKPDI